MGTMRVPDPGSSIPQHPPLGGLCRWPAAMIALFMMMSFGFTPTEALAATKEYMIKAAFLYQFTKFVQWPELSGDSITIGVLGDDLFGDAWDTIRGKEVRGKTIVVEQISSIEQVTDRFQILFVSSSERSRLDHLLEVIDNEPILTVGDFSGFASSGGMINFVRRGTKQKFEVNLEAVGRTGVELRSQLLQLAILVD